MLHIFKVPLLHPVPILKSENLNKFLSELAKLRTKLKKSHYTEITELMFMSSHIGRIKKQ